MAYVDSNLRGFVNILENSRLFNIQHLVFASSSSVYGLNTSMPFSTSDNVDHPISLYAATKKSNELLAHSYSYLYDLPVTGLRFFTVYGPWGRPDMALFIFTKSIINRETININNHGDMARDFTYIDDIVEGISRIQELIPEPNNLWIDNSIPNQSLCPYRIYNIGNGAPVKLMDFIVLIEKYLGLDADKNFVPMQPGDVSKTHAEISDLINDIGYKPSITVDHGVKKFIDWYKHYYKI